MSNFALIAVILLSVSVHGGEPFEAVFVEAVDGDTFIAARGDQPLTIHIAAIDAPEIGQAFGEEAAAFLAESASSGGMLVTPVATDASGEITAKVNVGGTDLGLALIEAGMAWYDLDDGDEQKVIAQIIARSNKRGLWADTEVMEPSRWRAAQTVQPTPSPRPRTLGEIAKEVELVKDADGRAVIEQPSSGAPNSDPDAQQDGKSAEEGSETSGVPGPYGERCCCEVSATKEDDPTDTLTYYMMLGINTCENGVAVFYPMSKRWRTPLQCVHETLCE